MPFKGAIQTQINNMSVNDISYMAQMHGVTITTDEANTLYTIVQNNWADLLTKPSGVFTSIQGQVSPEVYNSLINMYNHYSDIGLFSIMNNPEGAMQSFVNSN